MNEKDLKDSGIEITSESTTIDLGGYGAQSTYSISGYGTDTITLDPTMWTGSITTPSVTTINSINNNHYTIGATGTSGQFYTSTGTSGNWNNPPTVNISNTGIDMAAGTDIKVDGKSLKQFMDKMEERLAILVPDPAKLEKFEALKKAYEHYKLMEKLCQELPKEEE